MPMFEFKCGDCGQVFERLLRNASRPHPDCPHCSSSASERLWSRVSAGAPVPENSGVHNQGLDARPPQLPGPRSFGMQIANASDVTVRNCDFVNFDVGISVSNTQRYALEGNRFRKVKRPIIET
jgi:putative FmdB family regulatory protein